MEKELKDTTLKESFLQQKDFSTGAKCGDRTERNKTDVELNMLTHLLESHAENLGGVAGPVGSLLAEMGIRLPKVDFPGKDQPESIIGSIEEGSKG